MASTSSLPPDTAPPSFESHFEFYPPSNPVRSPTPAHSRANNDSETASILPPYSATRYGNYGSEAEYLIALRAWVIEKQYEKPDSKNGLVGFYGAKTMGDYANQPGLRSKKGKKERMPSQAQSGGRGTATGSQETGTVEGTRKKSSIGQWLSRKRTGAAGAGT